ncbi:hypothetical protein DICPUDRAFT_75205 [Dictyostelium purpureum]|uniref:Methylated-DNA--protein-cysteine methyltransferase n=1 Tax=Dictyostelium purpureum TaxID=5786 RepID=F0Z9Z5_DICPU|nr:uncharacterized protein DICPUDRAFT_75205 [Dictyostelium purpureum]EGC39202.1 hypothetical protein DICPUDRAFT_75205 [Dictyostelium purpureum]|eukprot:XP_003284229.1 hypothetical protein DICPUDRAFT_75205 [Dictyostelium purpureum]
MGKRDIQTLDTDTNNQNNNTNNLDNNNKKLKSDETLDYSVFVSPIGKLLVYANTFSIVKIVLDGSAVDSLKSNKSYTENNKNKIILQFKNEIDEFFKGTIKEFKTPYSLEYGTDFQKEVWAELLKIPYGETRSYAEIAVNIGKGKKYARAVASACRFNNHLLIIPCHRVISSQGCVVGYSGKKGIDKQFIISNVEKKFKNK